MRLFIAIRLSDEIQRAIVDVQNTMRRQGIRGNYTPKENLHLTLAFIGEYSDPGYVLEAIENVPFVPVALTLSDMGAFGDLWWIGLESSPELKSYVRRLRHALAEAGIPFDKKRFSPHITMLRRADTELSKARTAPVKGLRMVSDHVSLMRSDRGKNRMIYTEIM